MKIILLVPLILFIGCKEPHPQIHLPENYSIGQSINFYITGLEKNEIYSLVAKKVDQFDRNWLSKASFRADSYGQIMLATQKPESGTYDEPDSQGLFWSMTMPSPPGKDWEAPEPNDYSRVNISLVRNQDTLDQVSTKQWIIPQDVEKEIIEGEIVAEVFQPLNNDNHLPGILLLGGSGGGLSWARRMGALLANEGYVTMALSYFNSKKLPKHLAQIPLEYVDNALKEFASRRDVNPDKISILGYSKGAELALLMASRRTEFRSVAAIAPGSAIFQGFKPPKYPVISSWTLEGKDLPFVPNAYDKRFFETYDGMYLWYRTLAQHDAFEGAAIQVENINGDILLISGVNDQIWPATFMSEQIIARLHIAKFEHNYEHVSFPYAGHGIAEPGGHPTTSLSNRLGGTAKGNAKARTQTWLALKEFFGRSLK